MDQIFSAENVEKARAFVVRLGRFLFATTILVVGMIATVLYEVSYWLMMAPLRYLYRGGGDIENSYRFGYLNGALVAIALLIGGQYTYAQIQWSSDELIVSADDPEPILSMYNDGACDATCRAKIRARRSSLVGIEENEVEYVLNRYNSEYASSKQWRDRANNCQAHWDDFARAESYTMMPAETLMGKSYVEALGCQNITSTNGDGGYGPMQITKPDPVYVEKVALMLGTTVDNVRWKTDYFHNVLLGAVIFSAYEESFNSRGIGMLAYNHGPGNVRDAMRRMGFRGYKSHTLSEFRGAVPSEAGRGGRPRIYVDRVLAGMVMVDRAHRGLSTGPIRTLSLAQIPGNDPRHDGDPP